MSPRGVTGEGAQCDDLAEGNEYIKSLQAKSVLTKDKYSREILDNYNNHNFKGKQGVGRMFCCSSYSQEGVGSCCAGTYSSIVAAAQVLGAAAACLLEVGVVLQGQSVDDLEPRVYSYGVTINALYGYSV